MANTMPARVGRVACHTPEAMALGLPVPLIAKTSNTATMPVTVPSRPSSGNRPTRALVTIKGVSSCSPAWAIQAERTVLGQPLLNSSRHRRCHAWRRSSAQRGKCLCMYQKRSSTRVQNIRQSNASIHMTTPPAPIKSSSAWLLSTSQNQLACQLITLSPCRHVQCQQADALLFQQLNYALAAGSHNAVQKQHRNGHNQTQHGSNQRLGDTIGHQACITTTNLGNGLEGDDHAGYGTQQAK